MKLYSTIQYNSTVVRTSSRTTVRNRFFKLLGIIEAGRQSGDTESCVVDRARSGPSLSSWVAVVLCC